MVYDPAAGELLPDGSRIQETTAGELADWLAQHPTDPRAGCTCEYPQPYNLCCPARVVYPAYRVQRDAPRRRRAR
jgi:hypothetical protein